MESAKFGATSGKPLAAILEEDLDRFWDKVEIGTSCWNWIGADTGKSGYGVLFLGDRRCKAHRVAYVMAHGPVPPGMTVSHLCHNRKCVRPAHLTAESFQDNLARSLNRDRGVAKLTEAQVRAIRSAHDRGEMGQNALGRLYGVHTSTVHSIVHRQTWAWLED